MVTVPAWADVRTGGSAEWLLAAPVLSPTCSSGSLLRNWRVSAANPKGCQQAAGSEQGLRAFHRGLILKLLAERCIC